MIRTTKQNLLLGVALGVALLLATAPDAAAQWDWRGEVEMGLHQRSNIFKSPSRLVLGDGMLETDSLLRSDLIVPLGLKLELQREMGRHELALGYDGSQERYGQYGYLSGGGHEVELTYEGTFFSRLDLDVELSGRSKKSVSANVLGDELTRLFEYRQVKGSTDLAWELSRRHTLEANYDWRRRDYAETEGAPSIDYSDHTLAVAWTHEYRRKRRTIWDLEAELSYRAKSYREYLARDARGRQAVGHSLNRLTYYSGDVAYERALTPRLEWSVDVGATYRHDAFAGYYSYRSYAASTDVVWEPLRDVELTADLGWRQVGYLVKDAPQQSGLDAPPLTYDYLDWEFEVEYELWDIATWTAFLESDNRISNVTRETYKTRRSYAALQGGVAVRLDLDRLAR